MGLQQWCNEFGAGSQPFVARGRAPQLTAIVPSEAIRGVMGEAVPFGGVPPQPMRVESPTVLQAAIATRATATTYKSLPKSIRAGRAPRTRFFDPLSLVYAMGYKDRRFSVS